MISFASWIFDVCSSWHKLAKGALKFKCIVSLLSLKVEDKSFAILRCIPASPAPHHLRVVRKIVCTPFSEMLCIVSRNPE